MMEVFKGVVAIKDKERLLNYFGISEDMLMKRTLSSC